jgi:hypothetical protein
MGAIFIQNPYKRYCSSIYSTLLPQKCTKLDTEKQHAQGHLGSNLTPEGENRQILEKPLSPTAQNHHADLEHTCRDKVTKVGVIVRDTKNVIEKKNKGWGHI